ncbi:hypothetical protein ACH47Z_18305 [Streptomyces sp. NPDC020192]|uniref:hypothetical protein n=1 Tax=Streptomyces sp. NPDC020192 TaxID=3365066 RepID=UPI00378F2F7A
MNAKAPTVPGLDLTPTGHALPYIPEPPREHPENTTARPSEGVDFGKLTAALPEVVDEAMRETLPDYYTPEKAAQLAEGALANLREMYEAKAAATACGVR